MSKKSDIEYSKFWLGKDFDLEKELGKGDTIDLLRLAAFRRAIANFVFILTGKDIPVRFSEKTGQSMTDGKVVYIGGDLSRGQFDATVGLSLHEAAHIAKSDFNLIKNMWGKVPRKIYDLAGKKLAQNAVADYVKYVFNVVEDRYIDAWVYETSPGYRGYYVALYNRYFNLPKISAALQSQAFRKPTLKSYRFRLTNLTNPDSDLDALPGLREIEKMIDLDNILRLEKPEERMELAIDICEIIIKNIVEEDERRNDKSQSQSSKGDDSDDAGDSDESDKGEDSEGGSGNGAEESKNEEPKETDEDSTDENTGESKQESDTCQNNSEDDDPLGGSTSCEAEKVSDEDKRKELAGEDDSDAGDLDDKQMEELEKLIKKQEDVVNREIKQKEFDEQTIKKLDMLEKSGIDLVSVGGEMGIPEVGCIVVRNMTKDLILSGEFPFTSKVLSLCINPEANRGVQEGIVLGAMLGRRLQIRNEARTTRFNRLEKGKMDKRLISDLGFDSDKIFFQTQVDKYKNAHLHISVDASSSMSPKWAKTMKTVVAIAKAASMVNNLEVVVSFRAGATLNKKDLFSMNEIPYIVVAYDSRKDKFSKVTQLFPMLSPNGSTPEGLTFQAIRDEIPNGNPDKDVYFVNLSDGEPAFSSMYFGTVAQNHTKKQVNKIRESGVEVISYFIESTIKGVENQRVQTNMVAFRAMYGRDAQLIDVDNVAEIAHTLNKKFLANEK